MFQISLYLRPCPQPLLPLHLFDPGWEKRKTQVPLDQFLSFVNE